MSQTAHYKHISVLGPLSVEPSTSGDPPITGTRFFVLVGPTGAGKTTFVESLAQGQPLHTARQEIVRYNVRNLEHWGKPVILFDTPGHQPLETGMVDKVSDKLRADRAVRVTMCYFHALNEKNASDTLGDVIVDVQQVAHSVKANNIIIILTMRIGQSTKNKMKNAEQMFQEVSIAVYQGLRFHNISLAVCDFTKESILSILDSDTTGYHALLKPPFDRMLSPLTVKYNHLRELGPLLVDDTTLKADSEDLYGHNLQVYILMGPKSGGKSAASFIESLAPDPCLYITKLRESVAFYEILNLQYHGRPVILMDTPDLPVSERPVVSIILDALDTLHASGTTCNLTLCYFHDINTSDALDDVKLFAQILKAENIKVVTPVRNGQWRQSQNKSITMALKELSIAAYKILSSMNASLEICDFTKESTLSILDSNMDGYQISPKYRAYLGLGTRAMEYSYIRVLGPLYVERTSPEMGEYKGATIRVYILMGPTGAGKSAFIESLAPGQRLHISKDSIDSVTQTTVCYNVINLQDSRYPVILLDTPGLLDPKISERRVVNMISETLDHLRGSSEMAITTLCYFHPIDVTRVSGTKHTAVEYLKGFAQTFKANNINIVTTMWDKLWREDQFSAAEKRFKDLSIKVYKSLPSLNISMARYHNTSESALSVLDTCRHGWHHTARKERSTDLGYDTLMTEGLVMRIDNARQELDLLCNDDDQLEAVRLAKQKTAHLLHTFMWDLSVADPHKYRLLFPNDPVSTFPGPPFNLGLPPSAASPVTLDLSIDAPIVKAPTSTLTRLRHGLTRSWKNQFGGKTATITTFNGHGEGAHINANRETLNKTLLQIPPVDEILPAPKLRYLETQGGISVEPVSTAIPDHSKIYILMGATSSGRSSFVGTLDGGDEGYIGAENTVTTMAAYRIVNVLHGGSPVYIVTTPDLSDAVFSQMEIMTMIPRWMVQNNAHFFHQILFMTPITGSILEGPMGRAVKMLQTLLTATHDMDSVTLVTTKWDTVQTAYDIQHAESAFSELETAFKDFIDRGAKITRFMNDQQSALAILDNPLPKKRAFDNSALTTIPHLYRDLQERIDKGLRRWATLESKLTNIMRKGFLVRLPPWLHVELQSTERELDIHITQLIEYENIPSEFEDTHKALYEQIKFVYPELLELRPSRGWFAAKAARRDSAEADKVVSRGSDQ